MASRNDETWLFVVEWYDPMPRLKRQYLLKYFVQQHAVEMIDVKSKKIFLKKSTCPAEISADDFGVGKRVSVLFICIINLNCIVSCHHINVLNGLSFFNPICNFI